MLIAGAGMSAALPGSPRRTPDLPVIKGPDPRQEPRRPRRAALRRADAPGGAGGVRGDRRRQERGLARRAHHQRDRSLHESRDRSGLERRAAAAGLARGRACRHRCLGCRGQGTGGGCRGGSRARPRSRLERCASASGPPTTASPRLRRCRLGLARRARALGRYGLTSSKASSTPPWRCSSSRPERSWSPARPRIVTR